MSVIIQKHFSDLEGALNFDYFHPQQFHYKF